MQCPRRSRNTRRGDRQETLGSYCTSSSKNRCTRSGVRKVRSTAHSSRVNPNRLAPVARIADLRNVLQASARGKWVVQIFRRKLPTAIAPIPNTASTHAPGSGTELSGGGVVGGSNGGGPDGGGPDGGGPKGGGTDAGGAEGGGPDGGCDSGGVPTGGGSEGAGLEGGGFGNSGGGNTGYSTIRGVDGGCVNAISTNGGGISTLVACVTSGNIGAVTPAGVFSGADVPGKPGLPPPTPPAPPTPITPPPGPPIPPPATQTGGKASSACGTGSPPPFVKLSARLFGFSNFSISTGFSACISGDAVNCAARTGSSIAFSDGSSSTAAIGSRGTGEYKLPHRPRTSVVPSVSTRSPAASVTIRRVQ